jgi:MFS family permease
VALLLIAFERYHSPWAISLVLIADLAPAMASGPLLGAIADRWSRRKCMIVADVLRALAFAGIASVDSIEATVALAALAGVGTGMFTPAAWAALPSIAGEKRLPAATSLFGAIADLGFSAGPAIAALVFLISGPTTIIVADAVTFAISAVVLAKLQFGAAPVPATLSAASAGSLLREAREGLSALGRIAGLRQIMLATATALFFGGLFNVAELPFAQQELGAGQAAFSILATAYGVGFVVGSLEGSAGGEMPKLKRWFLLGVLVMGVGFLGSGLAPSYAVAMVTFSAAGIGNGLLLVHERLLIHTMVPDRLLARIFGTKDALTAWAFGLAFLSAGAIISVIGVRSAIVVAGVGVLVVWAFSIAALRRATRRANDDSGTDGGLARGADTVAEGLVGQDSAHAVGQGKDGLTLRDDLG